MMQFVLSAKKLLTLGKLNYLIGETKLTAAHGKPTHRN